MICISCQHEHNDNYCLNCGEKNGVKKITFSTVIEDALSTVTNMDKGFLFNIKSLLCRPQKIITDYINGKRKGILNPTSFLIITVSLYLVVITFFKPPITAKEIDDAAKSEVRNVIVEVGFFLRTYIKYFWILSIIPLALSTKLMFRKYNYVEHLAISSFIMGMSTLFAVFSYLIFKFPLIFDPIVYLSMLWLTFRIFKDNSEKIVSVLLAVLVLLSFIIQGVLVLIVIGLLKYFML
jgi:hypothetical protein